MTISKYAKLNCDIMESRWYRKSSPAVRLCWHYLILHVKAFGLGGTFRPLDVERFAETWHVEESDVEEMIQRASDSNALRCDSDAGVWELTGWGQHQGDQTGAERQRRYREKLKTEPKESVDRNDRNALRPLRNTEEKRREEKRGEDSNETTINTPSNLDISSEKTKPKTESKRFVKPSLEQVREYMTEIGVGDPQTQSEAFYDRNEATGWVVGKNQMKDWRAAVRTWKRNGEIYGYGRRREPAHLSIADARAQRAFENGWGPLPS